jgi:hypothetical protein
MGFSITDGTGKGYEAKVGSDNRAHVEAKSQSLQHVISKEEGQSYQVIGDFASINNSTHTILHIKNTSSTRYLVVTYIRLQTIDLAGGTAPPDSGTYWEIGTGRTVSSGGSAVTPVNMNIASGNSADATCTDNNPTMSGTFTQIDKVYPESEADLITYNKEGALILGKDDTIEIRIASDNTSGEAIARVSFIMENINGD